MQNSLVNLCECLETVGKVQGAEADGVPSDKLWAKQTSCLQSETTFLCKNGIVWSILGCMKNSVTARPAPRMRFYALYF